MRKSTFDSAPSLIDFEGAVVRINFDVERVEQPVPSNGGEGGETRTVYMAYVCRVAQPLSVDAVKTALIAEGFREFKAEAVASEALLSLVQSGEAAGDELALAKQMMTARIGDYDSSKAVDEFFINGESHWIPREYREMFEERLAQERRRGHTTVSLDMPDAQPGDAPLTLEVETAGVMLQRLNDYATDSYDCTQAHKRAVAALTTVEAVTGYDYTTGYPEKIDFDQMFEP